MVNTVQNYYNGTNINALPKYNKSPSREWTTREIQILSWESWEAQFLLVTLLILVHYNYFFCREEFTVENLRADLLGGPNGGRGGRRAALQVDARPHVELLQLLAETSRLADRGRVRRSSDGRFQHRRLLHLRRTHSGERAAAERLRVAGRNAFVWLFQLALRHLDPCSAQQIQLYFN